MIRQLLSKAFEQDLTRAISREVKRMDDVVMMMAPEIFSYQAKTGVGSKGGSFQPSQVVYQKVTKNVSSKGISPYATSVCVEALYQLGGDLE